MFAALLKLKMQPFYKISLPCLRFHLNVFLLSLLLVVSQFQAYANPIPATFTFGDSYSDTGNNNYIKTVIKANFKPYGRDFPNQVPTGRFTDGRLVCDFISKYVGVKDYVPPYLDRSLSIEELKTGVTFASSSTGFDPLTSKLTGVIPVPQQLENFKEYQTKLEAAIGKEEMQLLVKNSLYTITSGTNDFMISYYLTSIRRKTYDIPTYTDFLMKQIRHFMQGLVDLGARKIGFTGLLPLGCLPILITRFSEHPKTERGCIKSISTAAAEFNLLLQKNLRAMQSEWSTLGTNIAFLDVYDAMEDIIKNQKYDFEDVGSGCCGTGLVETAVVCNPLSFVCPNASKYVFFDSVHPTERVNMLQFDAIRPMIDILIRE